MRHAPIPKSTDAIARSVVDAAFNVHRALGAGLLESAYEEALTIELRQRGHLVERQVPLHAEYKGVALASGFRLDVLVDDCVVLELKAVDRLLDVHVAQLLTYLRLTRNRLGFLINFNVTRFGDGVRRIAL